MKKNNTNKLIVAMAIIFFWSGVSVAAFHPLDDIRNTAENYVKNQHKDNKLKTIIKTGYLDPRLRLKQCDTPLSAEPLTQGHNNPNTTITVKCNDKKPWTIYVPVKVKSYVAVAVAKRALTRGNVIQASDISYEERETSRLSNGYFSNNSKLIGQSLKRTLINGAVITPNVLAIKKMIRRGNRVKIIAETNSIIVRMPGKALMDAGKGDIIRVENLSSKRTVEGVVIGPGMVKVVM